jgi:hypothetical protein
MKKKQTHVRKVNNLLARETDTNKFETMNKREGHSLIQKKKERVILFFLLQRGLKTQERVILPS